MCGAYLVELNRGMSFRIRRTNLYRDGVMRVFTRNGRQFFERRGRRPLLLRYYGRPFSHKLQSRVPVSIIIGSPLCLWPFEPPETGGGGGVEPAIPREGPGPSVRPSADPLFLASEGRPAPSTAGLLVQRKPVWLIGHIPIVHFRETVDWYFSWHMSRQRDRHPELQLVEQ